MRSALVLARVLVLVGSMLGLFLWATLAPVPSTEKEFEGKAHRPRPAPQAEPRNALPLPDRSPSPEPIRHVASPSSLPVGQAGPARLPSGAAYLPQGLGERTPGDDPAAARLIMTTDAAPRSPWKITPEELPPLDTGAMPITAREPQASPVKTISRAPSGSQSSMRPEQSPPRPPLVDRQVVPASGQLPAAGELPASGAPPNDDPAAEIGRELQALGAISYRLERITVLSTYRFRCQLALSPGDPAPHWLEATNANPLAAMEEVLLAARALVAATPGKVQ